MPAPADAALIPAPAADAVRKPAIPAVAPIRVLTGRVVQTPARVDVVPMSVIRAVDRIRVLTGHAVQTAVRVDVALMSAIPAVARIRVLTGRAVPTPARVVAGLMSAIRAVAPIRAPTGLAVPTPARVVAGLMSAIRAVAPIIVAPATVGRMHEDRVAIVRTHVRTAPIVPVPIVPGVPTDLSPVIIRAAGTMPGVAIISIMTSAATSPTGAGSGI